MDRELLSLRLDGLVEPGKSGLEVLDFAGLARLSGFDAVYLHQERVV